MRSRLPTLAWASWLVTLTAFPAPAAPRPLLVTVDDLPIAGDGPTSPAERRAVTQAHLGALRRAGIRAVGFVTWRNVRGPEDLELLKLWLAAGHELGNHSDQHLSLSATDVETYRADVERARVRLHEWLAGHGGRLRFFRFPMLREGDTPEKVQALRRWLTETGQRNLPVTIDNQDWSFDVPWREARRARDQARQAEVAADYHAALRLAVRHHERRGDELLARRTPQVLLLHANAIGAAEWPRLFKWLARSGHRFAGADEVLADAALAELPDVAAPYGFGLWDRLRLQRDEHEARREVTEVLSRQAAAWSAGDLETFSSVYAEDALFISPTGQTRGRQAVLARYRERYPDRAAMGTLRLDVLEARALSGIEITPLGDAVPGRVHAASVVARWTLSFAEREPASGLTLLVLRRERAAWRIVQDASF